MWESLKVGSFRGIKSLDIRPLRRVNILVGSNNTGKTSLLEAAFLLCGFFNPQLAFKLNVFRGRDVIELNPTEIWGWLFNNKKTDSQIVLQASRTGLDEKLVLQLEMPDSVSHPMGDAPQSQAGSATTADLLQLRCQYTASNGNDLETKSKVVRKPSAKAGVAFEGAQFRSETPGYFLASRHLVQNEDAKLFSELLKKKRKDEVLEWLRRFDSRVVDIAVDGEGPKAGIIVDIGLPEYMPVLLAGEGTVRFLTIILRLVGMRAGTLLIDEAESGLHHSVHPLLWSAIFELAEATDNQVIATTHSWECMAAAHEVAAKQSDYRLSAFRLERGEDNEVSATTLSRENIEFGIQSGAEMR